MPELKSEGVEEVRRARIGWLTTLRPDGSPHVTPVWFILDDNAIWVATARRNVKVRNVVGDPRVSFAVDGSAADGGLVAEGVVAVVEIAAAAAAVPRAFAAKYDGWDVTAQVPDGERVLLALEVRRWLLAHS